MPADYVDFSKLVEFGFGKAAGHGRASIGLGGPEGASNQQEAANGSGLAADGKEAPLVDHEDLARVQVAQALETAGRIDDPLHPAVRHQELAKLGGIDNAALGFSVHSLGFR
jgi:hypothetical protein